jgi:hypothetical protein
MHRVTQNSTEQIQNLELTRDGVLDSCDSAAGYDVLSQPFIESDDNLRSTVGNNVLLRRGCNFRQPLIQIITGTTYGRSLNPKSEI